MAVGVVYAASAQAPNVSYTCKATALKTVLQEVGAASGYNLSAAGPLATVPIILNIKEMPLEKFMDHIARICHGEWMKSGETITLTRTPKMANSLIQMDQALRTVWIKKELEKLGTDENSVANWNRENTIAALEKEKAELEKLSQGIMGLQPGSKIRMFASGSKASPASTAATELIKQMPAERIAAIQPGQRVVFTNHPNQMQVPLPFRAEPTLERFRAAHNLVASILKEQGFRSDIEYTGGLTENRGSFNGRFGKTLLIVQRNMTPDASVSVTAIFTAEDGTIIGQADQTLWGDSNPQPKDVMSTEGLDKITLSKLSTEIAQVLSPSSGDGRQSTFAIAARGGTNFSFTMLGGGNMNPLNMSTEALATLTNPAKVEPLSLFPSEIVLGAAEAKKYGVIAILPDSAFTSMMALAKSGTVDPANFLDQPSAFDLKIEVIDGVQILTPVDPLLAERMRMNRGALQNLIQATYLKKYASLDDISKYMLAGSEISGFNNLDSLIVGAVAPVLKQQLQPGPIQTLYLKLYGSMSPQQRADGRPGGQVPLSNVMPQTRKFLHDIIFGANGMSIGGRGNKFSTIGMMAGGPMNESVPSIRTEPTEALPTGLPVNSFIQLTREFAEGLFAIITSGKFGTFMQPTEVGLMNSMSTNNPTPGSEGPPYTKFQLADLTSIQLQYRAPEFERGTMFSDGVIKQGSLAVSQEQLPAHILAKIKEGAEMGGSIRIGRAIGDGGGSKQP